MTSERLRSGTASGRVVAVAICAVTRCVSGSWASAGRTSRLVRSKTPLLLIIQSRCLEKGCRSGAIRPKDRDTTSRDQMRNVQSEDCAGACGTTDSFRAISAFCRKGNARRDAAAIGLAVFNVRLVTRDSVLGDCSSDETVQQEAADDGAPSAAVI